MSPRLLAAGLAIAASLTAGPALADAAALVRGLPCASGKVSADDVIASIIGEADVKLRGRMLASARANRLGSDLYAWRNDPRSDLAEPAMATTRQVVDLLNSAKDAERAFIDIDDNAPADLATLFLNGQAGGFVSFPCGGGSGDEPGTTSWRDALILTNVDDSGSTEDPENRPFASFSWLSDRETDEETASVDLYLGFSEPIWFGAVSPSLAYQRKTGSDPLNDLTFALAGEYGPLTWSAGYETDDDFDSALYRAAFQFDLTDSVGLCDFLFGSDGGGNLRGGRCDLALLADYVDVTDIGDKAGLLDRRDFARAGGRFALSWWLEDPATEGYWLLDGSYTAYGTLSGDDADADLGKLSISYVPGRDSPYSLGVSFERGADLTSFSRIDQVKVEFGLRR